MFAVEPLFTKMVLPKLGGAPAVWSVAMVFFQSMLLFGYLYAHALAKYVPWRVAALIHLLVLASAFLCLPIALAANYGKPPVDGEIGWLIGLFTVSIGLPFFALAGNGPLLQDWFARTGHTHAKDPYFLYSSSNAGSMLALLSYPVLFEPTLSLRMQSLAWMGGYIAVLALLIMIATTLFALREIRIGKVQAQKMNLTWQRRLIWTALAFIPSGLLVAVTAHISTDVAAVPFLWIIPLAVYLLTFILVFARRQIITQQKITQLLPIFVALLVLQMASNYFLPWPVMLALNMTVFFLLAMRCHGLLAADRPPTAGLTEYYLCMSFGGMLGGLFSGLIAPHIFDSVAEYPLLVLAGLLSLPGLAATFRGAWRRDVTFAAATLALAAAAGLLILKIYGTKVKLLWLVISMITGAVMLADRKMPLRFFLVATGTMLLGTVLQDDSSHLFMRRSFFGVHKVYNSDDNVFRLLMHGTTLHGAEFLDKAKEAEPITYYAKTNNYGQFLRALRQQHPLENIGVTGLGAGTLACHREKGERWSFFEIDPVVVALAKSQFHYLNDCAPDATITLGDARLTLAEQPDGKFDALFMDAFNSDAVPVHLLTREALQLYFTKLKPHGAVLLHISNRNLEMESMLATSAAELGLAAYGRAEDFASAKAESMVTPSHVVVLARRQADLGPLPNWDGWRRLQRTGTSAWRDDYSNIFGAMWRKLTMPAPPAPVKSRAQV